MGRYTTVQAFSDNNPNMRNISYEQATGKASADTTAAAEPDQGPVEAAVPVKAGKVKVEKVVNPYSSTAGAGSGEFHVYRHARAREMARVKEIDEADEKKRSDLEYQKKVEELRWSDLERTQKRSKKRQREKEAKRRKKALKKNGLLLSSISDGANDVEEEFEYVPLAQQNKGENIDSDKKSDSQHDENIRTESATMSDNVIPNDGSFLEMMMKKLSKDGNLTKESNAIK